MEGWIDKSIYRWMDVWIDPPIHRSIRPSVSIHGWMDRSIDQSLDKLIAVQSFRNTRFSVKYWRDLEIWVRCCSRSLIITPFDGSHTNS